MADLVDQDRLVEGRRARLHDTWLRPAFEGKRSTGDVEIHQNGIRWASKARSEHKCDILFSNIKHLFFQPCDNELIVLVHVHLKTPIMVGKKKAKVGLLLLPRLQCRRLTVALQDIQFYREASESSFDETGNRKRRRQHEEDELKMEQEERRQRAALNKEFRQFADKIADAVSCSPSMKYNDSAHLGDSPEAASRSISHSGNLALAVCHSGQSERGLISMYFH